MKKDRKTLIYIGVALLGLLLLVFGAAYTSKKEEIDISDKSKELDPNEYSERVESEVVTLCEQVVGYGRVSAVVSLSGGYRSVYASDSQSSSSGYKSNTVLVGSGSSEGAVLVCYENPEISGIGIVLNCKENELLKNSIISLVSAAFDVKSNKIFVAFGG